MKKAHTLVNARLKQITPTKRPEPRQINSLKAINNLDKPGLKIIKKHTLSAVNEDNSKTFDED